jgi:hypothetical protein
VVATKASGAEIAQEFGMVKYQLDNLAELLSGEGRDQLFEWLLVQDIAKSQIGGLVLGLGQSAERMAIPLTGWTEIYDRVCQFLAAEAGMPVSKLYGQAPGGLSTDDASAWRNWSAQVQNYQTKVLRRAYNRLIQLMLISKEGPTQGVLPERWMVELPPYEVPSGKEEADTANAWADALTKLELLGALTPDEARATIKALPGLALEEDDQEETGEGEPDQTGTGVPGLDPLLAAPAAVPDIMPKDLMTGVQIDAFTGAIINYNAGVLSAAQARSVLEFGLLMTPEEAARVIGERHIAPAPPAPAPRADEEDTYTPPKVVQDNARRALEVRATKPASQRGMTAVGLARARDLSNGRALSLDTVRRMLDYFTRHEVDKQGSTWGQQGKGWQAWMGWGGDEGFAWARKIVREADAREDSAQADPDDVSLT